MSQGNGPENVCLSCGACCAAYRVAFHWSETDAASPGGVSVEMTRPLRLHEVFMAGTESATPRCVALRGTVGTAVECTVYEKRPSPCRRLEPGSDQCRRARERYGLPPVEWPHA